MEINDAIIKKLSKSKTEMISIHDLNGVFLFASPATAKIYGHNPKDLIGKSSYSYFHKDDLHEIIQSHQTIREKPTTYRVQYRVKTKAGNYVWLETQSQVFVDPKDNVEKIFCSTRDIKYKKDLEAKLELQKSLPLKK